MNSSNAARSIVRCAIYTRKSTEEGLDKEFNSLDAQREAAEAFIQSQKHDGWAAIPSTYSDGGYTGANMERPGVRQLMADIQAGKVDCVVVYKVDRLSRSLIDFSKMMEVFEKHSVAFVSVTQQFNTKASLGRLTLNILLSFAQFEREIISERTRDKQVAARKKGKWTGGHLILGYDLDTVARKLIINPPEAEQVRSIFNWYLEGETILNIVRKAHQRGWRNKKWITRAGTPYGGYALRRTHLYNLLANPLYCGQVSAGEARCPGEHEAIIDQKTFDLVQTRLKQASTAKATPHRTRLESLLRGLIYCSSCGDAMYQTYTAKKERRYRYYVCARSQKQIGACSTRSVSAPDVEQAVVESIRRVGVHPAVLAEINCIANSALSQSLNERKTNVALLQNKSRNLRSQRSRLCDSEDARYLTIDLSLKVTSASISEAKEDLRGLQRVHLDERTIKQSMAEFEGIWKQLNTDEQGQLLRHLINRIGYDSRSGKVTVSFKSTGAKELCS